MALQIIKGILKILVNIALMNLYLLGAKEDLAPKNILECKSIPLS